MTEHHAQAGGEGHFNIPFAIPDEWPDDADARAEAEQRAMAAARLAAHMRRKGWELVPPPAQRAMTELIEGLEAHWPLASMRPPDVHAAIRAFREHGN